MLTQIGLEAIAQGRVITNVYKKKKKKEVNQPRLLPELASRCTDENQSEIEICIH